MWASLARRAMADHEQGRVTVVKLEDQTEYRKMRNGTQQYFRSRLFRLNPVILEQPDGLRVFMELQPTQAEEQSYGGTISATTKQGGIPVGNRDNQAQRRSRAPA
jgi:hypothetical protein